MVCGSLSPAAEAADVEQIDYIDSSVNGEDEEDEDDDDNPVAVSKIEGGLPGVTLAEVKTAAAAVPPAGGRGSGTQGVTSMRRWRAGSVTSCVTAQLLSHEWRLRLCLSLGCHVTFRWRCWGVNVFPVWESL